jgi:hypothetical protein
MIRWVMLVAALLALTPAGAQTTPLRTAPGWVQSANRFLPSCVLSDESPPDGDYHAKGFCEGAIYALVNAVRPPAACIPSGVTMDQATRVVVTYISARPARMHERFVDLAIEALKDAWPCKQ